MVQVQVFSVELLTTVLARIPIPFEDIVPRKLDLLLRQAIEQDQKDHLGHTDSEGNGVNAFRMRLLLGEVMPLAEIVSLE